MVSVAAGYQLSLALASVQNPPDLSGLSLSSGTLSPSFDPAITTYSASVPNTVSSITVTPTSADTGASITVNSSDASKPIPLVVGSNAITVVVTAPNGLSAKTYTVTVTCRPSLSALVPSSGTLNPAFDAATTSYAVCVPYATTSMTITPTVTGTTATLKVNGVAVTSGTASASLPLAIGISTITVLVTAQDGITTQTYTIAVLRPGVVNANYTSAGVVPVSFPCYNATGNTVNLSLGFAPPTGTNLTVVNNTGLGFITGRFSNLTQGQVMNLSYGGKSYSFVVNYYGGTGNDLVLQWAYQNLAAWGYNYDGELGNGNTSQSTVPVTVTASSGALQDKSVVAVSTGASHSLALCSDGTVASWGLNTNGQLGNDGTSQSTVPVTVTTLSGALQGKTVVSVAAGGHHSLALCSDGTVASWGLNSNGQLGNGNTSQSTVPVAVTISGVPATRIVIAISAGASHSLALCSDGTVVTWGLNTNGQLGNGTTAQSTVPVMVTTFSGALLGKTVIAVSAGASHSLALCSDGTVTAWGNNGSGQLGNNSQATYSNVPVPVTQSGVITGKKVVSVAAGGAHSLALCSDGTVTAWGYNGFGELGNNNTTNRSAPVLVTQSGVFSGKTVVSIAAGYYHNLALCSDGTVAAWGYNGDGELGNNSTTNRITPVLVTTSGIMAGQTVVSIAAGGSHSLVLASVQNSPDLSGLSLSSGTLSPAFDPATISYSTSVSSSVSSITVTPTSANNGASIIIKGSPTISGLASQPITLVMGDNPITIVVTAPDGVTKKTYTVTVTQVSNVSTLSNLVMSTGTLAPPFDQATIGYSASVLSSATSITVTPTSADNGASISVNGFPVISGLASKTIPLVVGVNAITIVVTAPDGVTTTTYTVTVTRSANVITSFASWISNFPSLTDSSPTGDPNHDGIPNLLEYVLNGNPGVASSAIPPRVSKDANNFIFTFRRLALSVQDTTQIFQYSSDMTVWEDVMITYPRDPKVALGVADANGIQTVTLTIPNGANARMFGRLKVTQP